VVGGSKSSQELPIGSLPRLKRSEIVFENEGREASECAEKSVKGAHLVEAPEASEYGGVEPRVGAIVLALDTLTDVVVRENE
jgi:hypothetical protein